MFDKIEQSPGQHMEQDIELVIVQDTVLFLWNDLVIQDLAEALGKPDFPKPRPCG